MILLDLQVHTVSGSADSFLEPQIAADNLASVGADGAAVTEHGPANYETVMSVFEKSGLICIPGREISFAGAHLLVLSTDLELLTNLPKLPDPAHDVFARDDVAIVWAHPAALAGSGAYPAVHPTNTRALSTVVHAVEVLNGRHIHFAKSVEVAEAVALELETGRTGGSDAHRPGEAGRCLTQIDAPRAEGALAAIEALRAGQVTPVLAQRWAEMNGYDYRPSLSGYLG